MAQNKSKQDKNSKKNYIFAVGRRREAVARVRLFDTANVSLNEKEYHRGDVVVNDLPYGAYFRFASYTPLFKKFFDSAKLADKFIFTVRVVGGGKKGQLIAVLHGMARALDKFNPDQYHSAMREHGYLTRDPRTRERRKVGMGGKARRKKQSPKR